MPHTKDMKMEGNMVERMCENGKNGTNASIWKKRRHVLFQSMYEDFVIVPLVLIMSRNMEGE